MLAIHTNYVLQMEQWKLLHLHSADRVGETQTERETRDYFLITINKWKDISLPDKPVENPSICQIPYFAVVFCSCFYAWKTAKLIS